MIRRQEQGLTLVMALILLVVLTLLALTSVNVGNGSLQTVSNMQQRQQAIAAVNQVLEETISSDKFYKTPDTALASPCNGNQNERCVDVDGDGKEDVHVTLTKPSCAKVQIIKNIELDPDSADDASCINDANMTNTGSQGADLSSSKCAYTVWNVNAVATDLATGATTTATQGVGVRVPTTDAATNCK